MYRAIVAVDRNFGIAKDGDMPWGRALKKDLRLFSHLTRGHSVIMGRKTFDTLPRPLKYRSNIVLTRDDSLEYEGATTCKVTASDLMHGWRDVSMHCMSGAWVIGGAEIYKLFAKHVSELYITIVDHDFGCDTFFPIEEFAKVVVGAPVVISEETDGGFKTTTLRIKIGPSLWGDRQDVSTDDLLRLAVRDPSNVAWTFPMFKDQP